MKQPRGMQPADLQDPTRDPFEKVAIVTDHDERAGFVPQKRLEPEDRFDVQVVRRLIEQEDVGRAGERARDREPGAPAPRKGVGRNVRVVESGLAQGQPDALVPLVVIEPSIRRDRFRDDLGRRGPRGEDRSLRDVADTDVLPAAAGPRVGDLHGAEDLQQRRLSRSVGPDEPDPVSIVEGERQPLEQRWSAERFGDAFAAQEKRAGHEVGYHLPRGPGAAVTRRRGRAAPSPGRA